MRNRNGRKKERTTYKDQKSNSKNRGRGRNSKKEDFNNKNI